MAAPTAEVFFGPPPSERRPEEEISNSVGMRLRLIPAGEFMVGSSKSPDELVRLFDDFWRR
jgi:hypothetical protein